eukprot:PRCOL_00000985-RA
MAAKEAAVCIVGVARTPMGGLQGSLGSLSAPKLGALAIKAAIKRAGIAPEAVEEVFMGNVLSANIGQAPAKQAALGAGLPTNVPCTTVNKVCASGMKATIFAAQSILCGTNEIVVSGGMESMTNAPYYLPKARGGYRMGHGEIIDGMIVDGLWDPYGDHHMGVCAEACADEYSLSRDAQDAHALESYARAKAAYASGAFDDEIVPVEVEVGRGKPKVTVTTDDQVSKLNEDKLRSLRTVFKKDGTVTAGNASSITDGAAALVLASEKKASELGLPVLARIRGWGDAAQDPIKFTTAPALAAPKALKMAGMSTSDIDLWEFNEAFSVVDLANRKILGLGADEVNVLGGAVALGHPIGCSGARILITLISALKARGGMKGCAAICNGGGGASAMVLERAL